MTKLCILHVLGPTGNTVYIPQCVDSRHSLCSHADRTRPACILENPDAYNCVISNLASKDAFRIVIHSTQPCSWDVTNYFDI